MCVCMYNIPWPLIQTFDNYLLWTTTAKSIKEREAVELCLANEVTVPNDFVCMTIVAGRKSFLRVYQHTTFVRFDIGYVMLLNN